MPRLIRALTLLALLPAFALTAAEPAADSTPEVHPGERAFAHAVAARHHLDEAKILATLDEAQYQQSIIDAISRPAEAKPWKDYRPIFLTDRRIADGVAFFLAHRALLERAAREFGVAPEYVVAILGVETSYGRITGRYRVIDALATLAFHYPPRAEFFRGQLEQLFALPPHTLPGPLDQLTGSYAGAMGWGQFMPSSIAAYARDYDGDGTIDLWNSLPDVVASVANYFAAHGWEGGAPVAARVQRAPNARDVATDGVAPNATMGQLEAWGYAPFVHVDPARPATLLTLDGADGPEYWAVYGNFQVITRYNRSPLYAMAVHQLAQAIAADVVQADLGR